MSLLKAIQLFILHHFEVTMRGRFIVFEGLDGCGKTTQMFYLRKKLLEAGVRCKEEREPSDGIIGLITRGAVRKKMVFGTETMAHLFAADRYEHVINDILPELERGISVLCDRYVYSSLAFQGLSMDMDKLLMYNKAALETLMPDLTLFIDVPAAVCARRISNERTHLELFEGDETLKIRESFLRAFELFPANVKIIDGDNSEEAVFTQVWDAVAPLFK